VAIWKQSTVQSSRESKRILKIFFAEKFQCGLKKNSGPEAGLIHGWDDEEERVLNQPTAAKQILPKQKTTDDTDGTDKDR
jgi:hypothetical protein